MKSLQYAAGFASPMVESLVMLRFRGKYSGKVPFLKRVLRDIRSAMT